MTKQQLMYIYRKGIKNKDKRKMAHALGYASPDTFVTYLTSNPTSEVSKEKYALLKSFLIRENYLTSLENPEIFLPISNPNNTNILSERQIYENGLRRLLMKVRQV